MKNSPYILYSPHRALDAVLNLGALPKRLLRVFYPLWRVRVTGHQRITNEFEEAEWFIERGIHESGLSSIPEIAGFFGLEERMVQRSVDFLRQINHIHPDDQHLTLTALGRESLLAHTRYEEHHLSTWLYFDGLDSRPLTRDHYAIPMYDNIAPYPTFRALYPFDRLWDDISLERMMQRTDRQHFNLPDILTHIEPPVAQSPVYLPIYIVERWPDSGIDLPPFLAFSKVRDLRDTVLEDVINVDVLTLDALQSPRTGDLQRAVGDYLARRNIDEDTWYLQQNTPWGAQIMMDGETLRQLSRQANHNGKRTLTIRDVGRYLLIYDWCVWLTCDDADIRQQAAVDRILEWLQFTPTSPTADDITDRIQHIMARLEIDPITPEALINVAEQQGLTRALEKLDEYIA